MRHNVKSSANLSFLVASIRQNFSKIDSLLCGFTSLACKKSAAVGNNGEEPAIYRTSD
jgi:hypothetical protein